MIPPSIARAASIAALALAASATSLGNGFTYDDRPIILENPRVHDLANVPAYFTETYWPERNGAALYRPVTTTAFALQWAAGGGTPRIYHVVSVALYAAICVTVLWLATLILPSLAAWVAAALFAVHPLHVEAVGNVVGQSELIAGLAIVLATALYLRDRLVGRLQRRTTAAVIALYALACLTKENGIVLPALLAIGDVLVVRDPRPFERRARDVVPLFATLAGIAVAYLVVRALVLGDVTGEFANVALADATFGQRLLTMLRVAPEWARLFLWPAHLSGDYSPREIEMATRLTPTVISGIAIVIGTFLLLTLAWRRRPVAAFGIAWTVVALLPVSNLIVTSGVVLGERTLFTPSVGVMIAVGALVALVMEGMSPPDWVPRSGIVVRAFPRGMRIAAFSALALLLATGAWRSAERQRVWKDNDTFFRQLVIDAPLSYRARWANGAMLFAAGQPALGEQEMRYAIALFPGNPDLLEDLAARYFRNGFCKPAEPLFRDALLLAPESETARMGLVACHLRGGRFREAAAEARAGLRFAPANAQMQRLARIADSLAAAPGPTLTPPPASRPAERPPAARR